MLGSAFALLVAASGAGAAPEPPFSISPSEVGVPEGVELGQFQRTIRPFGDWTLVCDDHIARNETVCNVRQVVADRSGRLVFSWALALTTEGNPYMVIRTAPTADTNGRISIRFEEREGAVEVLFDGCNDLVCVAMLPVGPIMRAEMAKNASPTVQYPTRDGTTITLRPTLAGLSRILDELN